MFQLQQKSVSLRKINMLWWTQLCRWLWKYPLPFLWSTLIINITVPLLSAWLLAPNSTAGSTAFILFGVVPGWVIGHWPVSLCFFTISVALLIATWRGSRQAESKTAVVSAEQGQIVTRDRELLLRRLRVRYEQLLKQSLQGVVQIEIGLASNPAAIQNAISLSWHLPEQPEQVLPPHTTIVDAYQQAEQDLLLLGEPGAGKSTLMLELAQHLVTKAEHEPDHPLPVLLPLSSWATGRRPLQEWIIEQFAYIYDVPQKLSAQCVQLGLILPLLDGLDEMGEVARASCIAAINLYHKEALCQLVVSSRTEEYKGAAIHERLALNTALVVQPLSHGQVDVYLSELGKPFAALRTELKKNPALVVLATTPLMLQILMLTYRGTTVRRLTTERDLLEQQIWTDYVQRMVERKGDSKRYPLDRTEHWLGWLARQMRERNQAIFSLELMQPDILRKQDTVKYQLSLVLLAILLVVCLFVPRFGLLVSHVHAEIVVEAIFVILSGLYVGFDTKIEPAETMRVSWKRLRQKLVIWLFRGLGCGLIVGLGFKLFNNLVAPAPGSKGISLLTGMYIGMFVGILIGLIFGLIEGLKGEQLEKRLTLSPNEGIQRSLIHGLLFWLGFGLLFVILGCLGYGTLVLTLGFAFLIGGLILRLLAMKRLLVKLLSMLAFFMLFMLTLLILDLWVGDVGMVLKDAVQRALSGKSYYGGILFWLFEGLGFGLLIGGLNFGLLAVVQHYMLRFWLWCSRLFPWRAVSFFEDATARIFLRRVGGGYSFMHRLLLEYFIHLETPPPPLTLPTPDQAPLP